MSPQSSFSAYREHLASLTPPCVPFIAVYLSDLTFINEGNPDSIDGLVNVDKRQMIFEVIAKIQLYQNEGYKIPRIEPLASYLEVLPRLNEDLLYDMSLVVEPREATGSASSPPQLCSALF